MDGKGVRIQSGWMNSKPMSQSELMAWEIKARRWLVLGLVGLVTGIFGVGLITLQMSYEMLKKTEVMREAKDRIFRDERVLKELGSPLRIGWAVAGEIEDLPERGTARFNFYVRGPQARAAVNLRAEKNPTGKWKYLLLEVKVPGHPAISCADG